MRAAVLGSLGLAGYSFYEPYSYRLTRRVVPVPPGTPELTVLHLSDTHMRGGNRKLVNWLRKLPAALGEAPDLVLATGDMIEEDDGIGALLEGIEPIAARIGRFYVFGSHDYYLSTFMAYSKHFSDSYSSSHAPPADTARLEEGLAAAGWVSLSNSTRFVPSPEGCIRIAGVDDPYLKRHNTDHIERTRHDVLAIGLAHAPDVVSEWFLAGFDLVLAGHTHAGQVRVPGVGALVTNCSLPNGLAGGLHRIGDGWLHVSPGLGVGKFSPIRFACRPEATLLHLRPGR